MSRKESLLDGLADRRKRASARCALAAQTRAAAGSAERPGARSEQVPGQGGESPCGAATESVASSLRSGLVSPRETAQFARAATESVGMGRLWPRSQRLRSY